MAFLITALHCEALPLIDHWGLRRLVHHRSFQIFRGETADGPLELIVSGIGKIRSAIATAALVSGTQEAIPIIVNIGVCAAPPSYPLGSINYINRFVDGASSHAWHPDPVLDSHFPEASLTTFDAPVKTPPAESRGVTLVDMEGSGFAEAASIYTAPSAWASLKVVSDHFTPHELSAERISDGIASHIEVIEEFIRSLAAAHAGERFSFSPNDKALLERFLNSYRLTASQKRLLTTAAREFVLRTEGNLSVLHRFLDREPNSKAELKTIVQEAHRALAES